MNNPYWNLPRWIPLSIRQIIVDYVFNNQKPKFEEYCKQIDASDWQVVAAATLLTAYRNGDMPLWWVWEWHKKTTGVNP